MPMWPLAATLAVQTLATMALYSLPAVAPEVARDLHVSGTLVGGFVATAYGVGVLSALVSPGLVRRYGGVRATQAVLVAAAGMLVFAALGSGVTGLALAAVVLGIGYGAAAPASTHLLVPQTPQPVFNLVMSLRQIGVPLGGVLAALILPPLVLAIGWRGALLTELGPVLLLIVLMEIPRRRWDIDREPGRRVLGRTLLQPFALLPGFQVPPAIDSGVRLCRAGAMPGCVYDGATDHRGGIEFGSSRAGPRCLPDRRIGQPADLGLDRRSVADPCADPGRAWVWHGSDRGYQRLYASGWPFWAVMANALLAGCTAGGYTGVAYAEYAALGGTRRTEATGLGTAILFAGGMALPPVFGSAVGVLGGYRESDFIGAACALASALLLALPRRR